MTLNGRQPAGKWDLKLLEIELTSNCNIHCSFCYLGEKLNRGEISVSHVFRLLTEAKQMGIERVVFTGGEPLLYSHLDSVLATANSFGWRPGLLTNGILLTPTRARVLAGKVSFVQLSLHDLPPTSSLARFTCDRIKELQSLGLTVTALITLNSENLDKLEGFLDLLDELKVPAGFQRFCPVAGQSLNHLRLDAEAYQRALVVLWRRMQQTDLLACEEPLLNLNMSKEMLPLVPEDAWLGCSAGRWAAVVTHDGVLLPCAKLRQPAADVFRVGLRKAWEDSPLLTRLRSPAETTDCGACGYARVCRGCRADPINSGLPLWGKDSLCPRARD